MRSPAAWSSIAAGAVAVRALRPLAAAAGAFFFWTGLLSALSYLARRRSRERIGLVNTMVFTHLPANVCLIAVPFAPRPGIAVALLLVRSLLSQMDVPTRTVVRHGGRHAGRARRGGERHRRAAQPRLGAQPDARRRAARRRRAGAPLVAVRRAEVGLRPGAARHVPEGAAQD